MVESKSVRITCDFCHKVVAEKKFIRFKALRCYYKIGKGLVPWDRPKDIHLCQDCYYDVRNYVVDMFGKRRR